MELDWTPSDVTFRTDFLYGATVLLKTLRFFKTQNREAIVFLGKTFYVRQHLALPEGVSHAIVGNI